MYLCCDIIMNGVLVFDLSSTEIYLKALLREQKGFLHSNQDCTRAFMLQFKNRPFIGPSNLNNLTIEATKVSFGN